MENCRDIESSEVSTELEDERVPFRELATSKAAISGGVFRPPSCPDISQHRRRCPTDVLRCHTAGADTVHSTDKRVPTADAMVCLSTCVLT